MPFDIGGYIFNDSLIRSQDYTQVIQSGLKLHLDSGTLESYPATGTTWFDLSGNSYDGTLTNGPTYSTDNKGTIVFDGSNDYITTADVDHGTSEFTLETWVYFNALNTGNAIIKKNTENNNWPIFSMTATNTGLIRSYYSSQIYGQCLEGAITATGVVTTGQWYHLCFSKGAAGYTTMKVYKNSVSQSYSNFLYGSHVNNVCNSSKPVMLGIDLDGSNYINPVNGRIPIARIYSRQLSDTEILHNYNVQKGRFGL